MILAVLGSVSSIAQIAPDGRVLKEMLRDYYKFLLPFETWKKGLEKVDTCDASPAVAQKHTSTIRIRWLQSLIGSIPPVQPRKYVEAYLER